MRSIPSRGPGAGRPDRLPRAGLRAVRLAKQPARRTACRGLLRAADPGAPNLLTTSKIGQSWATCALTCRSATPADRRRGRRQDRGLCLRRAKRLRPVRLLRARCLSRRSSRIGDRASGFGGVSGTVSDFRFDVPVDCTPTAWLPGARDCQILTSADTLVPGMVAEGKRSVVSTVQLPACSTRTRRRGHSCLRLPANLRHRRRGALPRAGDVRALAGQH